MHQSSSDNSMNELIPLRTYVPYMFDQFGTSTGTGTGTGIGVSISILKK